MHRCRVAVLARGCGARAGVAETVLRVGAAMRFEATARDAVPRRGARRSGPWLVSWRGVRTVTRLMRQRARATRWIVSAVVFAVLVRGLMVVTHSVVHQGSEVTPRSVSGLAPG